MKSRALTKRSKCKCYTKNGRKNVTSFQVQPNANYGRRQANLSLFGNFSEQYRSELCRGFLNKAGLNIKCQKVHKAVKKKYNKSHE